ncbi:MAG: DUF4364 family protein [Oscillospiraceae bacterium]|nr:DUF4364 family protein [Oscillospiraceae bacterium]
MSKNMLEENLMKISEDADRVITDPTLAGILLCYMLYRVDAPVESELLYDIAVTGGIINYFTYYDTLETLLSSGSVICTRNDKDEKIYQVSEIGIESAKRLKTIAAKSYRDKIVTKARLAITRKKNQKNVHIAYEPIENGGHLHVTLCDEELTLLELRLFTPDQQQADQIAEQILTNPSALYHDVIQAMMRRHDTNIDLTDN